MQLIRIDKNVAYNVLDFQNQEDTQTSIIIKSLLIYFSYSYQIDLFGYGTLDPHDFAQKMKLDKDSLFRTHPDPKQIILSRKSRKDLYDMEAKYGKFSTHRVWDSYLENALFIMSREPIFESYRGITKEYETVGFKNYLIIKDLSIMVLKNKKTRNQKIVYRYKLDDVFEQNLRRFFLQTNLQNYIACKTKNVEDFYLTLSNIINSKKNELESKYYFKLNDLLKYFNVSENLQIKHQKQKLNNHFKNLMEIMKDEFPGIAFGWEAGKGQRWKYVPWVRWDKIDSQKRKEKTYKIIDDVFYKHLKRNLLEIYATQDPNGSRSKKGFYLWLKDEHTINIKTSTYVSTYSLHYKISYPKPETLAQMFFDKVQQANSITDIEECFSSYS